MGKRGVPLPVEVFWQARQMYDELDQYGRRRYSMIEVAAKLGISEMSVLRAVKNQGRFANINATPLPPTRTEEMWAAEIEASKKKFLALHAAQETAPARTAAQIYLDSITPQKVSGPPRVIPPSPLDGGDAPEETEGAGLTKLVQVMKSGDALLEELAGQSKDQEEKKT